ncbi:hypothetical protein [Aliivibrio finisterrensis]|nr:hypothetical protein [Aliivibrio finisterrensis]
MKLIEKKKKKKKKKNEENHVYSSDLDSLLSWHYWRVDYQGGWFVVRFD